MCRAFRSGGDAFRSECSMGHGGFCSWVQDSDILVAILLPPLNDASGMVAGHTFSLSRNKRNLVPFSSISQSHNKKNWICFGFSLDESNQTSQRKSFFSHNRNWNKTQTVKTWNFRVGLDFSLVAPLLSELGVLIQEVLELFFVVRGCSLILLLI